MQATFRIWRSKAGEAGRFADYPTEVSEGMVVLDAVHQIQADQANDLSVAGGDSKMVGPETMPAFGEGVRRCRRVTAARLDLFLQSIADLTLNLLLAALPRFSADPVLPLRGRRHAVGFLARFKNFLGGEQITGRHHRCVRSNLRLEPAARIRRCIRYLAGTRAHAEAGGGDGAL